MDLASSSECDKASSHHPDAAPFNIGNYQSNLKNERNKGKLRVN